MHSLSLEFQSYCLEIFSSLSDCWKQCSVRHVFHAWLITAFGLEVSSFRLCCLMPGLCFFLSDQHLICTDNYYVSATLTMIRTGFNLKLDMIWHTKRCWGQFGAISPSKHLWRTFAMNASLFGAYGSRNRDKK